MRFLQGLGLMLTASLLVLNAGCSVSDFGAVGAQKDPREDEARDGGAGMSADADGEDGDASADTAKKGGVSELEGRASNDDVLDHVANEEIEGCKLPDFVSEKLKAKGDDAFALGWGGVGGSSKLSLVNLNVKDCDWAKDFGLNLFPGQGVARKLFHHYQDENKTQSYVQPASISGSNFSLCLVHAMKVTQELKAEGRGGELTCADISAIGLGGEDDADLPGKPGRDP